MSISKHLCTLKSLDSNQVRKRDCYLEITLHFGLKKKKVKILYTVMDGNTEPSIYVYCYA